MDRIDILITSASRPKSIKTEIETFKEMVNFNGEMNFHLHEDRVPGMERDSEILEEWAKDSGYFTTVYVSHPRVGRGPALNMLKEHANSKYIFYMEEDFDFVRMLDLNELISIMDNHSHVNQIALNWRMQKRQPKPCPCCGENTSPTGDEFFYHELRKFDGHNLRVTDRWTWQPALWRRSWIMPLWLFASTRSNKAFNNRFKRDIGHLEWSCEWQEQTFGAYYYHGKGKEKVYVKHTSWDVRHDRSFL